MAFSKNPPRDFSSKIILILFLVTFLLGIFSLRGFFTGHNALIEDAAPYIENIKFFTDHISHGVYPLWDPTREGGTPNEFFLRRIGEFNPCYWTIIFFQKMGVPFFQSYLYFLAVYLLLGMIGFYKLSLKIFSNRTLAFVAYLLLMFSTFPTFLFRSFILYLFVPIVWFFYFLHSFISRREEYSFLGMVLTLMVIATTYIPFYFLTMILFSFFCCVLIYPRETKEFLSRFIFFAKRHIPLILMGFLFWGLSTIPGILFYQVSRHGDLMLPDRNLLMPSFVPAYGSILEVPLQSVVVGGIPLSMMFKSLFSGFERIELGVFYVPTLIYLFFLLGLYVRITRKSFLFYIFGFIFFLIGLYDATPVYGFLYDHIFFFKFFRNFQFFFLIVILPVFILICVTHLKLFLESRWKDAAEKKNVTFFLALIHLGFAFFLYRQGNIFISSYLIVMLSLMFFWGQVYGFWNVLEPQESLSPNRKSKSNLTVKTFNPRMFFGLSLIIFGIIIQSLEVFHFVSQNARKGESHYRYKYPAYLQYLAVEGPKSLSQKTLDDLLSKAQHFSTQRYLSYFGLRSMDELSHELPTKIFDTYLQYKFALYDRVAVVDESPAGKQRMIEFLAHFRNLAFVAENIEKTRNEVQSPEAHAQLVQADSDSVRALQYDVNTVRIKTNFKTGKFLVYNDGFDPGWRGWINGRLIKIYRTNVAFKGFWVPSGECTVVLKFGSPLRYFLGYLLLMLCPGLLAAVIILRIRSSGMNDVQNQE